MIIGKSANQNTSLKNFFIIKNSQISKNNLYFISRNLIFKKIKKLEKFDRDIVAFRANLNLYVYQ